MKEIQINKKVIIWGSVIVALGAAGIFLAQKVKAGSFSDIRNLIPGSESSNSSSDSGMVITDHDSDYDYMLKNGTWYTRRKGTSPWKNMQQSLSSENYKLAVSRLEKHLQTKNTSKQQYAI